MHEKPKQVKMQTFNKKCKDQPYKPGWESNELLVRAYEIGNCNKDFIRTLDMENGSWDFKAQSKYINSAGTREDSWGFCQILRHSSSMVGGKKIYHKDIIADERFFTDQNWQLEQCWMLWKARYLEFKNGNTGATFYGFNKRYSSRIYFK